MLLTIVFGALSGVAIWFIIGLLNPTATEVLIRNFVWGWAFEWTFFIVEVLAAILYYYGWKRLDAKTHLAIGWIYFAAAWLSLVVINGIVTFMLTPGAWLETGAFWDGFLNPTYWPSLVFRTGVCIALAGLFALLVATRERARPLGASLVRTNAVWGLVGLAVAVPAGLWYLGAIPGDITEAFGGRLAIPAVAIDVMVTATIALGAGLVLFGLLLPRVHHAALATVFLVLGMAAFGGFEWFRESARKPYVITGYAYGNGIEVAMVPTYEEEGLTAHLAYPTDDPGADLFRHACRSCHTVDGYNALKPYFDGTDAAFIAGSIRGLHVMRGIMPPFPGTEEERNLLAEHVWSQMDQRSLARIHGLSDLALGRKVYEVRCGSCHVVGGYNDKRDSLSGLEAEDLEELLSIELADEMPPFSGTDEERAALVKYLLSLDEEEQP
jgi:mono/diheme cytochrome c family protein